MVVGVAVGLWDHDWFQVGTAASASFFLWAASRK